MSGYRYTLSLILENLLAPAGSVCLFVMLNPSTADALKDDPTVRKCKGFACRSGHAELRVVNLFALRATKPSDMLKAHDPVGPGNDDVLAAEARKADTIVVAWGSKGDHMDRDRAVLELLRVNRRPSVPIVCLGTTDAGHPRHPLYVRAAKVFEPYT